MRGRLRILRSKNPGFLYEKSGAKASAGNRITQAENFFQIFSKENIFHAACHCSILILMASKVNEKQ
jgi:hypothetical protein